MRGTGGFPRRKQQRLVLLAVLLGAITAGALAEQIPVRYAEGTVRGFLVLRTMSGDRIAGGELNQDFREGKVTSRLTFRFHDRSIHDETAVFTQKRKFRLLSYRLVQKGPSFPIPMEVSIDRPKGPAVVRYTTKDGETKTAAERDRLPADISNGMILTLVKNFAPGSGEQVVSMLGMTPEPRLVELKISAEGEESFSAGGIRYEATRYIVKVELGALTGLLANLLDKHPPDSHVWVARGENGSPGFVKAERPFYMGGPLWRIEMANPQWQKTDREAE